jgi:hypothetical protein
MMGTLARVFGGFIVACLTAGLVQVLFVMTPAQLFGAPSDIFATRLGETGLLALLAATHAAIFAIAFFLIAAGIAEWMGIRALPYYLIAGTAIAMLGFTAQYSSEVPGQPTIFNNYALAAYLASGFLGGLAYWLAAGRGRRNDGGEALTGDGTTIGVPPPKSWKTRPRILVEENPGSAAQRAAATGKGAKRPSLSELLAEKDDAKLDTSVEVKRADALGGANAGAAQTPASRGPTTSVPSTKPATSPAPGPQGAPGNDPAKNS